jgi:transcriptional regulator with XRE-family HTH domain
MNRLDAEDERRRELGRFLRTRRERIHPDQVGLSSGARRRTPGLRREELAQLAGVGVTWYTWLEQGRDIRPSWQVLDSLARMLRLDDAERAHLAALANQPLFALPSAGEQGLTPALQRVLDQQAPSPAYLMDRCWYVLGWNQAAAAVFGDFASLSRDERNMVWLLFTHPGYRTLITDWEGHARQVLAQFRASIGPHAGEPDVVRLVQALQRASAEFARWWPRHDVQSRLESVRVFEHPRVGRLVLQQTTFYVAEGSDLRLVLYVPLPPAETADKLRRLAEDS